LFKYLFYLIFLCAWLLAFPVIRRTFLTFISLQLGSVSILFLESSFIRRLYHKFENLFRAPIKLQADNERGKIKLPHEGYTISVETALNSRCNSDYDQNPKKFHWGMFDKTKRLSDEQIKKMIELAKIPRFTNQKAEIQFEHNILSFVVDNLGSDIRKNWLMIESGMQQQAVGLICAALGVGMVFKSLGEDGTTISDTEYATIKIKLDAMKPTYDGSFWTSSAPTGSKPWLRGNLKDPARKGKNPLVSTLERLKTENRTGKESTDETVGQLLWAARGRTPHLYKSRPWGMTIPTAGGRQNISSVYLISDNQLYRYLNWQKNRPTHSLLVVRKIEIELHKELLETFPFSNCFIVLGKNEGFGRALWEVGYQLLNLLLQAQALDLVYKAILLDENQKETFRFIGIPDPVFAFFLRHKNVDQGSH